MDYLVEHAERAQSGFDEMFRTPLRTFSPYPTYAMPSDMAYGYVAGVGLGLSKLGWDLRQSGSMVNPITGVKGVVEVSGFREYLVEHGQDSDVIKHVLMTSGGVLAGDPVPGDAITFGMTAYDLSEYVFTKNEQRLTEYYGDLAGYVDGKFMRDFALDRKADSTELKKNLTTVLCEEN